MQTEERIEIAFRYHNETKHHFHRPARGPGHLDWGNQPDPFRRYEGSQEVVFPFRTEDRTISFRELMDGAPVAGEPVIEPGCATVPEYGLGLPWG